MKLKSTLRHQSPSILAALGCLGFITSVIMTAKVAPKALEILEVLPENSTKTKKARALAPIYAPTAGMIMISVACIVGSNRIFRYRYASLLALYSIGEKSLQRWQNAVLDEVGEKSYDKVRDRVISPEGPAPESIIVDDERVLFFDVFSGRYFRADSVERVRKVVNDLNDTLYSEDFVCLNDFYFAVGLPNTEFGDVWGWRIADGNIKMNFDAFLKNDSPCISVSFKIRQEEY